MTISFLTQVSNCCMTGRVMDRYSGMEKGWNATGVRETKRRRKSKKAYREVNQEKTQERPVVRDTNI